MNDILNAAATACAVSPWPKMIGVLAVCALVAWVAWLFFLFFDGLLHGRG